LGGGGGGLFPTGGSDIRTDRVPELVGVAELV